MFYNVLHLYFNCEMVDAYIMEINSRLKIQISPIYFRFSTPLKNLDMRSVTPLV